MSQQDEHDRHDRDSRWPSFTTLLVIGIAAGLAWGIFFGPYGSFVKGIGDAYVGLMQMAVLPYVALSLTANIGRLSASQGGRVARVGLVVQVLLWGIGLLALSVMSFSFPAWQAGSFFSTSLISEQAEQDWLNLFIPSNPFFSLTNNLVPAVVLFFGGLGVALIPVPNKESLLDRFDILVDGLGRLNKLVLRAAPVGMFAIVGHTCGTLSWEQFGLLQGYLIVYASAALLLSLWVLPALVASFTPFSQRDVFAVTRDVLITAFVIGNTFIVLPMIVDAVKKLIESRSDGRSDSTHSPQFSVQLAYPFPDIGRIVGLVFLPFSAWFYGMQIDPSEYPQLMTTGFLGSFAKPIVTIPLLLSLAELPADIFQLYLAVGVVASRFGDLMKTMHLFTFSLLTTCVLMGIARFDVRRFVIRIVLVVAIFSATIVSIRTLLAHTFQDDYSKEDLIVSRQLLGKPAESTILDQSQPNPIPLAAGQDPMDRIRSREVIRIGIDTNKLPFSYYNSEGTLVGFDIDMAYQLAIDLRVRIEFVPYSTDFLSPLLADHFDVAMSGVEGTIERAAVLPEMEAYMEVTNALVVPDHRRKEFEVLSKLVDRLDREPLRAAVVAGSIQEENRTSDSVLGTGWGAFNATGKMDQVQVVEVTSERAFFESDPPIADVLGTNAEVGSAWTLMYPQYTVVRPQGFSAQTPLHYYVAKPTQLRDFMDSWLKLKRQDGTVGQLYDYWILGNSDAKLEPRWCILHNVLGWVD
jgi:Na+/H+-dicarboxylate symporter/ABC-type amino acid transport substrate-binding protein